MHHYQPGYLFIPFGMYTKEMVLKPKRDFIPPGVEFVLDEVTEIDPKNKRVGTKKGRKLNYDFLVVALGCRIAPEEVEGMMEGWIEMQFKPGGKVVGRDHSGETGSWSPWSATWKVDGRTVIITKGKRRVETLKLDDCSGNWIAPGRS